VNSLFTLAFPILCVVLPSGPLASQGAGPVVHLLKAQDYYGRRSFEGQDSVWYGLYRANDQWLFLPSRVTIDTIATPRGCTSAATRVGADRADAALFLIQGLPGLSAGPLQVVFDGSVFVYPGRPRELRLGEADPYRLSARGTRRGRPGDITFAGYELLLDHGVRKQVLASFDVVEEAAPGLVFAGDLDRDQRLDLILDLRRSYVGHRYALFVSSFAESDSLVLKVAELPISGC